MIAEYYPWHEESWQQLLSAKQAGRLHHGLLLVDKLGTGLAEFAQALAAKLLCEEDNNLACGQCSACLLHQNQNHPDYLFIEPEEEGKAIKVDQVRSVNEFFALTAHAQQHKVVVIQPADAMNRNAANGLLKILEEPPKNAVLILATNNDAFLPITIRSRCQKIHLGKASSNKLKQAWLEKQITTNNSEQLLRLFDNAPLYALDSEKSQLLNERVEVLRDVSALLQQQISAVHIAKKWSENNPKEVIRSLWGLFADMTKLKLLNNSDYIRNIDIHELLNKSANQLSLEQLMHCVNLFELTQNRLAGPYNLNALCVLEEIGLHLYNIKDQTR